MESGSREEVITEMDACCNKQSNQSSQLNERPCLAEREGERDVCRWENSVGENGGSSCPMDRRRIDDHAKTLEKGSNLSWR